MLVLIIAICITERLWRAFITSFELDGAVHNSADIASRLQTHWHAHGEWPAPGEIMNRGYHPTDSVLGTDGRRTDRYSGIGGPIQVQLDPDGTLRVDRIADEAP